MELKIIQGNVLDALKRLPDESVNLIVTSPPYWGLRNYGVGTNTVWGGDKNCKHKWELCEVYHDNLRKNKSTDSTEVGSNAETTWRLEDGKVMSAWCNKCGAWYGQLGLEPSLDMYIEHLLEVTAELKRVLRKDGIMFWNHGDSYNGRGAHFDAKNPKAREGKLVPDLNGYPKKCLHMQNYRLAMRMVDEQGWILRNIIIWAKKVYVYKENKTIGNGMPSSVKDRFATSYEPIFMFVKSRKYWSNLDSVRVQYNNPKEVSYREKLRRNKKYHGKKAKQNTIVPNPSIGKNPGDVWQINTQPLKEAHFAPFPERLVEMMIKFGCPSGGIVMDPFMGSGTTLKVSRENGCSAIGIEINKEYTYIAKKRIKWGVGLDINFLEEVV